MVKCHVATALNKNKLFLFRFKAETLSQDYYIAKNLKLLLLVFRNGQIGSQLHMQHSSQYFIIMLCSIHYYFLQLAILFQIVAPHKV